MNMEKTWKKLLLQIIEEGHSHTKDDTLIHEIIGVHEFLPAPVAYGLSNDLSTEQYLNLIKKGYFDIQGAVMHGEALHDYVASLDDSFIIDGGDFVYTYPERLLNHTTVDRFGEVVQVDQLEIMQYRLTENPGSNRAVATLYNCGLDGVEEHIPCLNWIQALIRNNKLTLTIIFRSNDCYGAWTSNMMFIHYIGFKLVESLKEKYPLLQYNGLYYNCSSLHIYDNDLDAAKKVVGL